MQLLQRVVPSFSWVKTLNKEKVRDDIIAGFIAAVVIMPQAAALAALAGMPPQYGVYASVFPVMTAAIFGSCWHSISGPNTAVAIMVLTAVIPWANVGTPFYIGLAFTLAFIVGAIQILMSLSNFGYLMEYISSSVVSAITSAVGVLIIVTAGWGFIGVYPTLGNPFLFKLWHLAHDIFRANPWALLVGSSTIIVGLIVRRIKRKYALVVAMFAGIFTERLIAYLYGWGNTNIELVGHLALDSIPISSPMWGVEAFVIWQSLVSSGIGIALVGVLQTVVIAKSMAEKSGQNIDLNKEIFGQGIANVVASFTSGFPGSASFNRSAAHHESGAQTPLSAFLSGIFLFAVLLGLGTTTSYLSTPTVSGILILVGLGLLKYQEFKKVSAIKSEAIIFYSVFFTALISGLADAILIGLFLSGANFIRKASKPFFTEFKTQSATSHSIKVRGSLFFGSVKKLQLIFADTADKDERKGQLILDLQEAVDIDHTCAKALELEAKRRHENGGSLRIQVRMHQLKDIERGGKQLMKTFRFYHVLATADEANDNLVELQSTPPMEYDSQGNPQPVERRAKIRVKSSENKVKNINITEDHQKVEEHNEKKIKDAG